METSDYLDIDLEKREQELSTDDTVRGNASEGGL
jgi:hypothetical protein